MKDRLATIYVGITLLVSIAAVGMMLLLGEPTGQNMTEPDEQEPASQITEKIDWYVADETLGENAITIGLPAAIKKQQVTITNDYRKKELLISVSKMPQEGSGAQTISGDFFYDNPLRTGVSFEDASLEETADAIVLSIPLASVREWESKYEATLTGNFLHVQLVAPKDKYEKIIVLDAGHGGSDDGYVVQGEDEAVLLAEGTIAYEVVSRAGSMLEKEGIHVYYTREEQENPELADRVALANEAQADMLISVHADFAEDTTVYGMRTIYNETYFIPTFGSADLAYLLLEKVASRTNEKAIGFEADSGENELIRNAMVPVAQLNIGYLSNKQEQKLLSRDDYIQRIAEGLCDAVFSGYEEIEK